MVRRRAPIGDRLAAAIENARDPRDRALLAEVADVIAQLTRAHGDQALSLCGMRVRRNWLHYPDDRARCVRCSAAIKPDEEARI